MNEAVFLVSGDGTDLCGFVCANHQTGLVWALFVWAEAQGRGHGTALLAAATTRLRDAGNRQAFRSTGFGTKAEAFCRSRGWEVAGTNLQGEVVPRLRL